MSDLNLPSHRLRLRHILYPLRGYRRIAAAAALLAPAASGHAQGLRSGTASVSLIVIKPAAGVSAPRTRDATVALPPAWRDADEVTLMSDAIPGSGSPGQVPRLFVRDPTHRLVELAFGAQVTVGARSGAVPLRLLLESGGSSIPPVQVRAVARWRATGREDARLLPVAYPTP